MNTYYIANNKTKQYTIYQTNKTRQEIWNEIENDVDIVHEVTALSGENKTAVEEAQSIAQARDMQYVPYDSFIK